MVESHDLIFSFGPVSLAVVWLREVKETCNSAQGKLSGGLKYISGTQDEKSGKTCAEAELTGPSDLVARGERSSSW